MDSFCSAETYAEMQFSDADFIGMGDNSEVWSIDGVAIKVATPTTGRRSWRKGRDSPEDLIDQFIFMKVLGDHLDPESDVLTPIQHFALQTPGGNYLRAEEYMETWSPIGHWLHDRGHSIHDVQEDLASVKTQIARSIGSPILRFGLNDLGLGKDHRLHTENILVPSSATDISEAPLCIIDQPTHGIVGKTAAGVLRRIANRSEVRKLKLSDLS
jgi:hypothetical protein